MRLPAELAEPLHILVTEDGGPWWPWWLGAALFALGLAWLARKKPAVEAPAPTPMPPLPAPLDAGFVAEIRRRFDRDGDFRRGCHALAAGLREHLGRERHVDLGAKTVTEIERRVSDPEAVSVLTFVRRLQFQRFEPTRKEFYEACDRAGALSAPKASPDDGGTDS